MPAPTFRSVGPGDRPAKRGGMANVGLDERQIVERLAAGALSGWRFGIKRSITRTRSPRASRGRAIWVPMKPAPPVISTVSDIDPSNACVRNCKHRDGGFVPRCVTQLSQSRQMVPGLTR